VARIDGTGLRGRRREREALDRLLRDVHDGSSRVLVLHGEPGAGKTALLDYLDERATTAAILRIAGVECEAEIAYSALHQLCAPLLDHMDALPEPQRIALGTAFGMSSGPPPQSLILGLAVLGLLAEAAADRPLVCIVDDVQWVDRMSAVVLGFAARRLGSESVALVFASRDVPEGDVLAGLPDLRVDGLGDADARALLDSVLRGPVDDGVRDRIIAETRGNPLALIELPRSFDPAALTFGLGAPGPGSLASRLEHGFRRQLAELPNDTRRLLLVAAVEPVGDATLLRRALDRLGIALSAAGPAEAAGLLELAANVRFRHPLVRTAAWRSADPDEVRAVHRALAEVVDPVVDPDRYAWHRAHGAVGPDECIASELESSADRALARGGRVAAAAFLERAVELTPDPKPRADRALAAAQARFDAGAPTLVPDLLAAAETTALDPAQRAHVERLRAQVAFAVNPGVEAGPLLLAAAARLEPLDAEAARHTYLTALAAAVQAGRSGGDAIARAARAARAVPAGQDPADLLLTGLSAWALDGYAAAAPALQHALRRLTDDGRPDLLWLTVPVALEMWDARSWDRLTGHALAFARTTGTLALLPTALAFRAAWLMYTGRAADAAYLLDEAQSVEQSSRLAPKPAASLVLAAYRGREAEALELIDSVTSDARARGEGRALAIAGHARAVLYNGLGRYPAALEAARDAVTFDDLATLNSSLAELVEAAVRADDIPLAAAARERMAARTTAAGTEWAGGAQAVADALVAPPERAEVEYRRAIELLSATSMTLQLARAQLLYGEWLRRSNRRADARDPLRRAHDVFAEMGAEAFAERAARELAATGEQVQRKVAGSEPSLTAQETQIARLAVAGQTNPEIGATLFLSPRTVEWHLGKIFVKLGVRSRRELAAALGQR